MEATLLEDLRRCVDLDPNWCDAFLNTQDCAFKFWQNRPFTYSRLSYELGLDSPPCKLFAKDSWSEALREEHKVHDDMQGHFGAGVLYGHQKLDSNEFFYHPVLDITPWAVLFPPDTQYENLPPFDRTPMVHWMLYFVVIGKPLSTAKSPRELLGAIFHAMMAHFTMWWGYKYLHRDISTSNILITAPRRCFKEPYHPLTAPMVEKFKDKGVLCEGLLIDADLARDINEKEVTDGEIISGTCTSLSRRLHQALKGYGGARVHSPVDDIESSIWVLVITLYEQADALKLVQNLDFDQRYALEAFKKGDLQDIYLTKELLVSSPNKLFPQCPPLDSFTHDILKLCGSMKGKRLLSEEEAMLVYHRYFDQTLQCLDSKDPMLAAGWKDVFSRPYIEERKPILARKGCRPPPLPPLADIMGNSAS
ncbi:hypothetical protein DL93DRAFT_1868162 [Clavulina sp. PMI_390]|nr:hypothetical protein DL93DRAFT_1868162 [Clavulina sp. PMI_390]